MATVSAAKPKTGGAVYYAPAGTTLPTDATTSLNAAFKSLGYISEDGLTNADSKTYETVKAWGGDTVLTALTEHTDTFSFKLIEYTNVDALKAIYGDANVTSATNSLTVKSKAVDVPAACWCVEMIMEGGKAKRIVIPNGKISEVGEIAYGDSDAVGYEVTVTALPDATEVTHYEYMTI